MRAKRTDERLFRGGPRFQLPDKTHEIQSCITSLLFWHTGEKLKPKYTFKNVKFQVTFYPLLLDDSNTMSGIFIKSKKTGDSTMSDLDLKGAHGVVRAPRYQISKGKMEGCKIIWRNILRNI